MTRRTEGTIPATAISVLEIEGRLWLLCAQCDREAMADLSAIVAKGLGERPLNTLRFRCSGCGSTSVHPHLSSASADRFRPKQG
jgi:hypothetical protein